ncbi:MAG TPA: hypothetical protein VGF27_13885, partial [Pseudoduganella sp.]
MNKRFAALPLLTALSWPLAASADTNAFARLGNVGYIRTDLDPNDGITPMLTFSNSITRDPVANGYLSAFSFEGGDDSSFQIYPPPPFPQPYEFSYQRSGQIEGRISLLGREQPWQQWIESEAHIVASPNEGRHLTAQIWSDDLHFTVTPGTGVTFYATLQFQGSISPLRGHEEWIDASSTMYIWVDGPDPYVPLGFSSGWLDARVSPGRQADSEDVLDLLHASWQNRTGQAREGKLTMDLMLATTS